LQGWAIDNRSDLELEEHRGILAAITNGDFDTAAERLKQHIKNFAQIVVKDSPR
jgi:DNA-binding GntR family transcriptional regulator